MVVHLDPDLPKNKLTRLTSGLTEEVYSMVRQNTLPFFKHQCTFLPCLAGPDLSGDR